MTTPYPPQPKQQSNTAVYIALALLAVLAAVTVVVVLSKGDSSGGSDQPVAERGPRDTVVGFMKAAETGDAESAKKYVDPSLHDTMTDTSGIPEDQTYEVGDEEIDGDSATVPVSTTTGDGVTANIDFKLSKSSGEWLITDMALG